MSTHTKQPLLSARHRRAIIVSIMAAAALYLGVVISTGHAQAWQGFRQLGWQGWLLVLACSLASYVLRYLRWQYYLQRAGWVIAQRTHFLYYLAGFALTTTPGKAGETIRSVLLRPHGVPFPTSLASFFCERLLDVIVIAALTSLILTAFTEYASLIVLAGVLLVGVLSILHSPYPARFLSWLSLHLHGAHLKNMLQHLAKLLTDAQSFLAPQPLVIGVLLGVLAWTIQGLAFYYILQQTGMPVSLALALGIYALSLLAGAVSMIPGGLGSTELAMGLLLAAAGADQTTMLTVPIISRLATLWFAVCLGLLATAVLSLQRSAQRTTTG